MKTTIRAPRFRLVLALLAAAASGHLLAASLAPVETDRAAVSFRDPSRFNDASGFDRRTDWLEELGRHVAERAARTVPAGDKLLVTIDDVQRAGTPEPWRGIGWSDLRVVRDTTPPRIELTFQLVTTNGAVLKEGSRTLRNIDFLHRPGLWRNEPLAYEKRLIDDWMSREFGTPSR